MLLASLSLGLLMIVSSIGIVNGAVEGKSYYFTTSQIQSYEENGYVLVNTRSDAWFKIDALNITRDILYYNFEGYHWSEGTEVEYQSEAIHFQDNMVYFDLHTYDPDNDSYSTPPSITVYPTDVHYAPGRYVFVNPTWSTHETDWDASVDNVESMPSVQSSTFSAPGDGTFSFTIIVNVETIWEIADNPENATGTTRYDFSASYDDDGVLNSLSLSSTTSLSNEDFTSRSITTWQVLRASGPGAGTGAALDMGLVALGVAIPVSLLVGLVIGKLKWD
jgi:hypothetical protein